MGIHGVFLALLGNLALVTLLWVAGASVFVSRGENPRAKAFRAAVIFLASTALCALVVQSTAPFVGEWVDLSPVIKDGRLPGATVPVWLDFGLCLAGFCLLLAFVDPRLRVTWLAGLLVLTLLYLGMSYFGAHGALVIPWLFAAGCLACRLPFEGEEESPWKGPLVRTSLKAAAILTLSYICLLGYGRLRTPTGTWPLEKIIASLGDKQLEIRKRALRILRRKGRDAEKALPVLDALLRDDPALRRDAALAMAGIGAGSLRVLSRRLMHENEFVRLAAAEGIRAMGPGALPAVEALVMAAHDREDDVQSMAIRILGALGDKAAAAAPALLKLQGELDGRLGADVDWAVNRILGPPPPPPGPYNDIFEEDEKTGRSRAPAGG